MKLFYRPREVADLLEVPTSTILYWVKVFPSLRPNRTEMGHRRYSAEDVETLKLIKKYLYSDGLSIKAAQRKMAVFRKHPPRNDFICRSSKDAVKLLTEAKERSEDDHVCGRIDSVVGWVKTLTQD